MFAESSAMLSLKATLCYDMLSCLPDIWDSYEKLSRVYPEIKYSPTLDTCAIDAEISVDYAGVFKEVCAREYAFYRKNRRFLMSWFDESEKRRCRPSYRVFLHSDGNQYVCHGCPYVGDPRLKIGDISAGKLLFAPDFKIERPRECARCDATYCVACEICGMSPDVPLDKAWGSGRLSNKVRCGIYKAFGRARNTLIYALTSDVKGK